MAEEPHYLGHRERLRQRFLNDQSLYDYELLELLLFQGNPRRDTKPMAKKLLDIFGSLERVLSVEVAELEKAGLNPASITAIKIVYGFHLRLLEQAMYSRESLNTYERIVKYCQRRLAPLSVEVFHVVYMDADCGVIRDVTHQKGGHNQVTVYPKDIMKVALDCGAAKLILAHNHPGGDAKPSFEDLQLTEKISNLGRQLDIITLDHIIVGHDEVVSLKALGYL
jgi:DNA repair protein RadC